MNATPQTQLSLLSTQGEDNVNETTDTTQKEEQQMLLKNTPHSLTNRDKSFDVYRGIIMITMALDHLRWTIATGAGVEMWYGQYPDYYEQFNGDLSKGLYYFILRFLAQMAAPGFMLLMGFGMVHFYEHRHGTLKWSHRFTTGHLVLRGVVIVIF